MEKNSKDKEGPLFETKEKKVVFFALMIAISFESLLWMAIICLFPIFIAKHHESINTFHIGLILSIFHFSTLIITPIIGKYLHFLGRKNALVVSFCFASMAALGYSLLSFV
jgi:MFS family permease